MEWKIMYLVVGKLKEFNFLNNKWMMMGIEKKFV